ITGPVAWSRDDSMRPSYLRERARRRQREFRFLGGMLAGLLGLAIAFIGYYQIHNNSLSFSAGYFYLALGVTIPVAAILALNWPRAPQQVEALPIEFLRPTKDGQSIADLRPDERNAYNDLVKVALDQLMTIRFQQSYTAGWSGSLKIPVAEVGRTAS